MIKHFSRILFPLSILFIIGFLLFVVNQISGVYLLVKSSSVLYANILLAVLSALALILVTWPVVMYLKLPSPLKLPRDEAEQKYYQKRLVKRLRSNKYLKQASLVPKNEDGLPNAIEYLDKEASKIIRETSNIVFLTTSVSQNGKLDALTVLITQSRMVWKIAHIYYQRPTLRELIYLYANVGASTLLASEIEDLDISTQIEPVLQSFFRNSAGKSIPVIGPTANIILDSLMEGSTNAFLTLRIGNIASKYCGSYEVTTKEKIRKAAFSLSVSQLKEIVLKSSARIFTGLLKATRKAGTETLKSGWDAIAGAGGKIVEGVRKGGKKVASIGRKTTP
ncbi:MAG: DUF697 domain-containing protein [Bacteroidota bacterium]